MRDLSPFQDLEIIYQLFRKDYFIYDLGKEGLFCLPLFRAWKVGENIQIQFLANVTPADEAGVLSRLAQQKIIILPARPTLEEIEKSSGVRFGPD